MSLVRTSAWAAAAAIVLTVVRFTLGALTARILSQQGFGQFAYLQWLVDLSFIACSLGVAGVAARYVAQLQSDESGLAAFMQRWRVWALVLPIVTGVAVIVGSRLSGMKLPFYQSLLLSLWAASQGWWAMQTAVLVGCKRFDRILISNVLAGGIILVGVTALPIANDLGVLFAIMAVAACVATSVGFSITRKLVTTTPKELPAAQWGSIRNYAVNIWITTILWSLVWSRGEMPVVRGFLGDVGVARYSAVLLLFAGAIQAAMLAVSGVAPELTRLWGIGKQGEAIAIARRVTDLQLLVCGSASIVLSCIGPEILIFVFGPEYRSEAMSLGIISLGLVSITLSSQNHILQIATDARFNRNTSLMGLVCLFLLAFCLLPLIGVYGAAIARAVAMGLLGLISFVTVRRKWGEKALSLRNFSLVLMMSFAALAVGYFASDSTCARMIAGVSMLMVLAMLLRDSAGTPQVLVGIRVVRSQISRFRKLLGP